MVEVRGIEPEASCSLNMSETKQYRNLGRFTKNKLKKCQQIMGVSDSFC